MPFFGRIIAVCIFAFLIIGGVNAKEEGEAYRDFWLPTYHGERLNYCSLDGKLCGRAVATRYCKMMGYLRANQQIIDHNVGCTHFMPLTVQCKGWRCNAFKKIRCVANMSHKPPQSYHYRLRRFVYPYFNNCRVAWCYDGQKGCGRRAAFSFCRRMGYLGVRRYAIQSKIAATKAIGNQILCFGNQCKAFDYINCYR